MPRRRLLQAITVLGALTFGLPALAIDDVPYGAEYQTCTKGSTVDIEQCIGRLTRAWDRRLNAAYRMLLKSQPRSDQLRIAQRLWLQFRDANGFCENESLGTGCLEAGEYRIFVAHNNWNSVISTRVVPWIARWPVSSS